MSLMKFQDWIIAKESSPATRSKTAAALGLGPDVASIFGHSTPPPWQVDRLSKKCNKVKSKKTQLPGDEPSPSKWFLPEKTEQHPDYSFDKWVDSALKKKKEVDGEKENAKSEEEDLDKKIKSRLKEREKEGGNKIPQGNEEKDGFKWEKKIQKSKEQIEKPEDNTEEEDSEKTED